MLVFLVEQKNAYNQTCKNSECESIKIYRKLNIPYTLSLRHEY
jgi:hypothetical protein